MKIKRNKAIVANRTKLEKTYKVREYLWGLIKHEELLSTRSLGWDLVIRVEEKPKNIYLQIGDNKPKKLQEVYEGERGELFRLVPKKFK